jgi:type III secretion protein C
MDKATLMTRFRFLLPVISLSCMPYSCLTAAPENSSFISFSQLNPKQQPQPQSIDISLKPEISGQNPAADTAQSQIADSTQITEPTQTEQNQTASKNSIDLLSQQNDNEKIVKESNDVTTSDASLSEKGLVSTFDLIAQENQELAPAVVEKGPTQAENQALEAQGPVINFNNVNIVEFLRFVSRLTGRNFIFDPQDLQFPVTIISETPASIEDIMAALLQNLKIHEFDLIEQGSSFLIHRNKLVRSPSELFKEDIAPGQEPQLVTQVFLIEYVDPSRAGAIIKTMVSKDALVELISESKRLVITDIYTNIKKIAELLTAIDSPNNGLEIGQYVTHNATPASLISLTSQLLAPLTKGQTFILVPNTPASSVFIVSSSFLVEKALSIMQTIDLGENESRRLPFEDLKFNSELARRLREEALARQKVQGPKGFTTDEIKRLTDEEIQRILAERGLTKEAIGRLTKQEIEDLLQGKGLSKEALARLGQKGISELLQGLTDEQIKNLTDEQIRNLLRARGLTDEEIARLTKEQIHAMLQQNIEFGPFAEAKKSQFRQQRVYESNLPIGQAESTQFLIHRLQYRRSGDIVTALHAIAASLQSSTAGNSTQSDLITTLNTIQTIDENNSIVLTGTPTTLTKAKDLINEIDVPVRQVLIEVLVLDTTITNSLNFGVEYGVNWRREDFSLSGGLFKNNSATIPSALGAFTGTTPPSLTSTNLFGTVNPATGTNSGIMGSPLEGLTTGSIGRRLIHKNTGFVSFAAIINAVRDDEDTNIIFNPKITTEHNVPAEIFVGQQIGIKGQSISNDTGTIVTTNFNTQQTGISLKVTPLISSKETITLIIEQTISSASAVSVAAQGLVNAPPATINETRAVTRVHLPNEYFLVMAGSIQETRDYARSYIPCLGALPLVGNLFANSNVDQNNKRNLMLFIRPTLIDTDADIEEITRKQQDIFYQKSVPIAEQKTAVDDLIDLLNLDP